MASSRFLSSRVLLVAIALIIASSAILTSMRLSVRVPAITQYIKWNKVPFSTTTASGLGLSSSMAPAQYKKPPQLPPKFTASPVSLIEQTKKLVCLYSHGVDELWPAPRDRFGVSHTVTMIPESWQQGVDFAPPKRDPTSNFSPSMLTTPRLTGHGASKMP